MINVTDLNASANFTESTINAPLDDKNNPFKSIFKMKIDQKSQLEEIEKSQYENNLAPITIYIPINLIDTSHFKIDENRQKLLNEAKTAKKEPDEDVRNAQSIMYMANQYLFGNKSNETKAISVKKDELFSAIKGLKKMSNVEKSKSHPENFFNRDERFEIKDKASAPIERRKLILEFKDAKIAFSPEKINNQQKDDKYKAEVSTKSDTNKLNLKTTEEQKTSSNSSVANKNGDHSQVADNASTENKNEKVSKDQLFQMVKDKSNDAATEMLKDDNIKLEFKPSSEKIKSEMTNNVIKANQESAVTMITSDDVDLNLEGVEKIAPSGNLKELLNNQEGLLQVNDELVPVNLINEISFKVTPDKMGALIEGDSSLDPNMMVVANKDMTGLNEKAGFGSGKALPDSTSSSVLDRINQVAMVQKISKRIQVRQLKEFGVVNIQLDPPELGKLMVKMTIKGKDIKVSILAESGSAHELLKNHKNVFIQSMKENGLNISDFEVVSRDGSNHESSSQMNDNKENFSSPHESRNLTLNQKEINQDHQQINSKHVDLSDGYHISLIA